MNSDMLGRGPGECVSLAFLLIFLPLSYACTGGNRRWSLAHPPRPAGAISRLYRIAWPPCGPGLGAWCAQTVAHRLPDLCTLSGVAWTLPRPACTHTSYAAMSFNHQVKYRGCIQVAHFQPSQHQPRPGLIEVSRSPFPCLTLSSSSVSVFVRTAAHPTGVPTPSLLMPPITRPNSGAATAATPLGPALPCASPPPFPLPPFMVVEWGTS